ncbi:MAG: hypothetical protein FWC12_12505 [Treponema sp.]|nr:hypothetical protein [Treponema sp.]
MALTYHPSTLEIKNEIIANSSEMQTFFEHIEERITNHPELGLPDMCLLENGKSVSCYKQSIEVYLFSGRIRYGRSQLTLLYLYNNDVIYVFKIYFSE